MYGRRIVFSCANWWFVIWQIGCALAPNMASLIVVRLLTGEGAVSPGTIGAGVIADLFPVEKRGLAASLWGSTWTRDRSSAWRIHRRVNRLALSVFDPDECMWYILVCYPMFQPREIRPGAPSTEDGSSSQRDRSN